MHYDFSGKNFDEALDIIGELFGILGSAGQHEQTKDRPEEKAQSQSEKRTQEHTDAILKACRKYCREHECASCKVGNLIDDHHSEDDWCAICSIASSDQPIESMLAEVMRFDKYGDPKPKSYLEDYFEKYPDAVSAAIEKNGIKMPHVCRVSVYDGKDICPGGKTCWQCWQERIEK